MQNGFFIRLYSNIKNILGVRLSMIFTVIILAIPAILFILIGCEEGKRYEITGDDTTPPAPPIFIDSKPLHGGSRVYFRAPADEDVLLVEASYANAVGEIVRFTASYFTDSLDVMGFGSEGDHQIELCAVDRAGNRSRSIRETVASLEPPVVAIGNTIKIFPSFSSMLIYWESIFGATPFYVLVDFSYVKDGTRHNFTRTFASDKADRGTIEGLMLTDETPVSVKVRVKDMYGNISAASESTIALLTDDIISKEGWTLPASGTIIGGITQASGENMDMVKDDKVELDHPFNFFITTEKNPWSIIIDLGEEYELSRVKTHQRWSGHTATGDYQGNLYRGQNVLSYNIYGWDKDNQSWEMFSSCNIRQPIVTDSPEYRVLGVAGDLFFLYPEEPKFSKPTRLIRFEAANGRYVSEITLYGRKAQ